MKNRIAKLVMSIAFTSSAAIVNAQMLNLSINNLAGNVVRIVGTATAPGFTTGSATAWGAMGVTLRIPKSATTPAPTPTNTGAIATNITSVSTGFTGATPGNAFTGTTGLAAFDLTAFGQPDDNYWYFQITETTPGGNQAIAAYANVVVYQFTVPATWHCTSCMEIVTTQIAGLPFSTIPFVDNSSTGGNVLNISTATAPLPITLVDFTAAKTSDSRVQLNWQTPVEQGSDYFDVQRSTNGKSFDKTVAHVKAAGFSNNTLNYQSYDAAPYNGDNFYRLKMVNVAGNETYSVIRKVHFADLLADVVVYPTDNVDGVVRISLPLGMESAGINLIDGVGRQLPVSVAGIGGVKTLSLKGLSAGNYMVQVNNGITSKNFKIIYHP